MRRSVVVVGLAALTAWIGGSGAAVKPGHAAPGRVVQEQPVSVAVAFNVKNTNTSKLPCPTDEKDYTIRGDLVGLPSDLAAPNAVTLYLHGSSLSRIQWRMPVPGYDYAWEMAKLGHVSVAIDQLGYDASGHPDGNLVCVGGNADIAHQIVQRLRSGEYGYGEAATGPAFEKVVIGGNSAGGIVAEVAAYSYHDVDGLILSGAGDLAPSIFLLFPQALPFALTCAQGGEPPEDHMTEPLGYAYLWPNADEELKDTTHEMDPAVADVVRDTINRDPCAYETTVQEGLYLNNVYSWTIDVPVLLIYGVKEKVVGPQPYVGMIQQAKMFGSDDVTLIVNPDEGHIGMIESRAAHFRQGVHGWLSARGF